MLKGLLVFALIFTGHCLFGFQKNDVLLSNSSIISLITCEADTRYILTSFGHTALRVYDPVLGIDNVYYYGELDSYNGWFIVDFIKNELAAKFNTIDFELFSLNYSYFERRVTEQPIILDSLQKQKIFDDLIFESALGHNEFSYRYFTHNCTTRIRDIIYANVNEAGNIGGISQSYTYRGLLKPYLRERPWTELLFDIFLGIPADKSLGTREAMFLPLTLKEELERAKLVRPLVENTIVSYQYPYAHLIIISLTSLCLVIFSLKDYRKKRSSYYLDLTVCIVTGTMGTAILVCWLCYNHTEMGWNLNLLWLLPSNLLCMLFKNKIYYKMAGILCLTLVLFWSFLPQEINLAILPIVSSLSIRYFVISLIL